MVASTPDLIQPSIVATSVAPQISVVPSVIPQASVVPQPIATNASYIPVPQIVQINSNIPLRTRSTGIKVVPIYDDFV